MKTVNEMLAALTAPFLKQLEAQAQVFKVVGDGWLESPRWFQYRIDKNERGILYIGHSQCDYMFIKLDISMFTDDEQYALQHADYMKVYDHFKKIKYAYLRKNHPTIDI